MTSAERLPEAQGAMVRDALEDIVAGEHQQVMTDAQLSKERIDCAYLYAMAPTSIAQFRRINVILSVWHQEWQRRKPSGKSLKQFLQDKPGCEYWFAVLNALDESHDVRTCFGYRQRRED
jgi:hypothetical protein